MIKLRDEMKTSKVFELSPQDLFNSIKYESLDGNSVPTYFEVILGKCRAYVDIDRKAPLEEDYKLARLEIINDVREKLKNYKYCLLDGCRKFAKHYKHSFHIIFQDIYFNSGTEMKEFIESLELPDVDYSVYKDAGKTQIFRTAYSGKDEKENDIKLLYILDENNKKTHLNNISFEEFEKTLITVLPPPQDKNEEPHEFTFMPDAGEEQEDDDYLDFDALKAEQAKAQEEAQAQAKNEEAAKRLKESLKKYMPKTKINGKTMPLKDNSRIIELGKPQDECPFCKRIHKNNRNYIVHFLDTDSYYLKCHDKDSKNEKILLLEKKPAKTKTQNIIVPNKFDFKNPYDFQAFYNYFNSQVFSCEDKLREELSEKAHLVISKILRGEGFYVKKGANDVDMSKRLGLSDIKMKYIETHKSGRIKIKTLKLSDFLSEQQAFSELTCSLDNPSDSKLFNIWPGFKAQRVDLLTLSEETAKGLEMMKQFIFDSWASGDEHIYKYIISWFAGLVQNLKGINRVALAMVSAEGCGKNTLTDFLKFIIKSRSIAEVVGIQSITQKHNMIIQNKRLVVVNEMSSTREEFRSNFDKIKNYITDQVIKIEPKGIDSYDIHNIGNYILFTNHADSIIISNTDRRYAAIEMSDIHVNDVDYFTELRSKCFNQQVANAFFTYLLDFKMVKLADIPETNIRKSLQTLSQSTPMKFLDAVVEEQIYKPNTLIPAAELYARFTRWCEANGEKSVSNTKFGLVVSKEWDRKRSNGIKYIVPNYNYIDPETDDDEKKE